MRPASEPCEKFEAREPDIGTCWRCGYLRWSHPNVDILQDTRDHLRRESE